MQQDSQREKPRRIPSRGGPSRLVEVGTDAHPPWHGGYVASSAPAASALEFGRFCVLLRRRQLFADGVPVKLGTRAFDLLLVLLEADGSLVRKEELLSRVWPGIVVSEVNLKVQVCALRKALGRDRDFVRTECSRGYRFTGVLCSNAPWRPRVAAALAHSCSPTETFVLTALVQSIRCSFSSD
jgi:DNA-binding winged helix-turn-helix (wHTH) protein